METRRFTLTISDSEGHPRRGEVVLTQRWQPQWGSSGPARRAVERLLTLAGDDGEEPPAAVEEFQQLLEEALAAETRAGRRARVSLDAAEAPVSEE
jgi:hypothetical protein